MTITYRWTSIIALASLVTMFLSPSWLSPPQRSGVTLDSPGVLAWDPCRAYAQMSASAKGGTFVFLAAFVVLLIQGLRNRQGSRSLAILGLLSTPLLVISDWWRISAGCYSPSALTLNTLCLTSAALMFIHHAATSASTIPAQSPTTRSLLARAWRQTRRNPASLFLASLLVLAVFTELRSTTYDADEPGALHSLVLTVQHGMAWITVTLFVLAVAASIQSLVVWAARRLKLASPPNSAKEPR